MVRDGDAALRDTDFRHGLKHPNAGNVPQDFDNEEFDSADDVLPCYSYQPNGIADMNLNPLLVQNIRTHDYFKGLAEIKNFGAILDEIYTRCSSLNFWMGGSRRTVSQGMQDRGVSGAGVPATPVVLLYKLYTLRLTRRQIKEMLNHADSPYIRALGVLYLRHVCDPKELWGWLQPYVADEEELSEFGDGAMSTLGKFVCRTLVEPEHIERDVRLPRIPVPTLRDICNKLAERGLIRPSDGHGDRGSSRSGASHHRRDAPQRDDQSKRRAVDGGPSAKPEKRKCDYCKRFSCIC
ncbi:MAG: hypothetical protein SGPRY_005826 [Prymnesium sp.]